jgi:hypothetical protein
MIRRAFITSPAKKNDDGSMNWIKCVKCILASKLAELRKSFEEIDKD